MASLQDELNLDSLYTLMKGEPGTRKSTSALSYPKPQYWFSWDKKMRSLLLPMRAWNINPTDIEYDDYSDWSTPRRKLEQFQSSCKFKTIVLDSITSMADSTLQQTMKLKSGTTRKSGADAGKNIAGIAVNEMEDYNAESAALAELIALTKDIHNYHKIHVILIAHVIQAEYKSAGGDTHMSRTIVTAGKRIAAKIPAYCEEVYHFNIEKSMNAAIGGDYALLTSHTGDDFARTSLPLEKKIVFGNESLYERYILPATNQLKESLKNKPQLPLNKL